MLVSEILTPACLNPATLDGLSHECDFSHFGQTLTKWIIAVSII
jgi:hypothetical protein